MLEDAEERGMLDEGYDDPQIRHGGTENTLIESRSLSQLERNEEFVLITTDDERGNWGQSPLFIIVEVPDETWRKILLIDTARELCTFRSTTTDTTYRMKRYEGMSHPWLMDRSMQDASAAMMRQFLQVLRGL